MCLKVHTKYFMGCFTLQKISIQSTGVLKLIIWIEEWES